MRNHSNASSARRQRITQGLCVIPAANGLGIVAIAVLADLDNGEVLDIGSWQQLLAAIGFMYVILGGMLQQLPFFVARASLILISVSMFVLFIEG